MAGGLTISTLNDSSGVLATQNGMSGIAKAWVNFNGTNGSIRASFNVSSVTRGGTGQYAVNFSTAMPDANYSTQINLLGGNAYIGTVNSQTSSVANIYGWTTGSSFFDSTQVTVSVFR
jgi:hypothetical protein